MKTSKLCFVLLEYFKTLRTLKSFVLGQKIIGAETLDESGAAKAKESYFKGVLQKLNSKLPREGKISGGWVRENGEQSFRLQLAEKVAWESCQ